MVKNNKLKTKGIIFEQITKANIHFICRLQDAKMSNRAAQELGELVRCKMLWMNRGSADKERLLCKFPV